MLRLKLIKNHLVCISGYLSTGQWLLLFLALVLYMSFYLWSQFSRYLDTQQLLTTRITTTTNRSLLTSIEKDNMRHQQFQLEASPVL